MLKKTPKGIQRHFFKQALTDLLNPDVPLLKLAATIPWDILEAKLTSYYSHTGRPAKPIRLMAGLLILKQLENMSDERIVELWTQNPYFQAFCGMKFFQWHFPCNPSDMTLFRQRIGEEGCEEIFKLSVAVHGEHALEQEVVIDTTVQEKNITFPTDAKLHAKIIIKCRAIAKKAKVQLRRTYQKEVRGLLRKVHFDKTKKNKRSYIKAKKRLKTIAGCVLRDLERKLSAVDKVVYAEEINKFAKVLKQTKTSKRKIYSLHEPQVECIAKGKAHKKYEFGAKAGFAMTKLTSIIVGVKSFVGNPYDGDTLSAILEAVQRATNQIPTVSHCDRGFQGREKIGETIINTPMPSSADISARAKKQGRTDYGRRSAIEPIIGHVKNDHRMARCYLKGSIGDTLNLLMAAAAFNFKKWIRKAVECLFFVIFAILRRFLPANGLHYAARWC